MVPNIVPVRVMPSPPKERAKPKRPGGVLHGDEHVCDPVDPLTDETTTIASKTEGVLYMRRAIRFVTAGAPLGRVTGTRAFRTGVLLGA